MTPLRVGILGAGWWAAANHLPLLRDREDVEITAVCRKGAEQLAKVQQAFDVPFATEEAEALLAHEALDAVVISTPHQQHAAQAVTALERGLHVMCEKPLAVTMKDALWVRDAARASDRHFLVPYGWNFSRLAEQAAAWIAAGEIGEVRQVVAQMASPMGDLLGGTPYAGTEGDMFRPDISMWSDPASGGYGWGQTVHLLGLLFMLVPARPVQVIGRTDRTDARCDLYNAGLLTLDTGATVAFSGAGTLPPRSKFQVDLRIYGTNGCVLLDMERERASLMRADRSTEDLSVRPGEGAYSCTEPVHRYVDLCRGKDDRNPATIEIAATGVAVVDALHASARSAAPVNLSL